MRAVPFLLAVLILAGCKTRSEIRREQEFERVKQDVAAVRGDRADSEHLADEMRQEMSRLANLVEDRDQQTKARLDEIKKELATLTTRLQAVEQRAVEEEMAARKAAEERSKASFDNARKLYDDERYEEAAEMFKAVMRAKPKSDEARRAQFYVAESYFNSKDYASAALEFGTFNKNYPKDQLVPTAIYRQAHAFRNMGKGKEARLFYQELIDRFPKSALTAKAKGEMKKLK